ncbi:TetR/AcrR family transcriptional regulator [Promethearchaeum syntrophicum]|uniref:TetR/AcrR family transcriptional regulator n=1 Tax=Promethearchaeum syntrophicum TaxID=2594042 RepID=A0A5B9DD07_9ARCH|nr:TetR/AcrR family transcriptional regulator [Candidatus Prometheoarchaeum syntrophicum]
MDVSDQNFEKKQEIANKFMEFFLKHGMVKTIVNDVSKELHMSKKTIYKYFKGGKQDCLYFIFSNIGHQARMIIEKDIMNLSSSWEKIEYLIRQIYEVSVPYVLGNAAENDEDYVVENRIVGNAFKDVFQDLFIKNINQGINKKEFSTSNANQTFNFIYGVILESMIMIHDDPAINILDQVIKTVRKILKK